MAAPGWRHASTTMSRAKISARHRSMRPLRSISARATFPPDDLDGENETPLAIEERASLSPDALTGMEASLRFAGGETIATKIFGRLSAWQNWIFIRPNATGEHGALKRYGSGAKARFDWERV